MQKYYKKYEVPKFLHEKERVFGEDVKSSEIFLFLLFHQLFDSYSRPVCKLYTPLIPASCIAYAFE